MVAIRHITFSYIIILSVSCSYSYSAILVYYTYNVCARVSICKYYYNNIYIQYIGTKSSAR